MSLILGMDSGVFAAWLLTILSAILCIVYGIYHEFIKKKDKQKTSGKKNERNRKEEG